VRAYALCIVAGIFVCLWLTVRRWRDRGGVDQDVWDVAGWAIAFGIVGGRLYNVITDAELYFGRGRHPIDALKIWDGGLGIWGAIALGTLGAWIGCRRHGMRLTAFADAAVPGVAFAQGIGRWGNYFNNELYGGHTSVPWKLQVHCFDTVAGHATACNGVPGSTTVLGYFQPTFLYESIWDIALGFALLYASHRWRLGKGNTFALYAMGYTVGRAWIEALRSDFAHRFLGLRLNDWTALVVFVLASIYFLRHRTVFDESIYRPERAEREAASASEAPDKVKSDEGKSDEAKSDDLSTPDHNDAPGTTTDPLLSTPRAGPSSATTDQPGS
jgi:prolipoprotein diacylglyceryl transferase